MHLYGRKKNMFDSKPPSAKQVVKALQEHAQKLGEKELSDLSAWMFNEQVRTAFFIQIIQFLKMNSVLDKQTSGLTT
jgi:hypothetical protein